MKGYSSRKRPVKRQYDVFLIVCEGSKTERIYFNRFRRRGNNLQILTPDTKYTDPENLVNFAIEQKHALNLNLSTGDRAWCVFDVDENTNETVEKAVSVAKSNGIGIILSNPCFEVWYILHYCDWNKTRSSKEVASELKTFLPRYSKSEDIFDVLEPYREVAARRADSLLKMHHKNQRDEFKVESNPCTLVHNVVDSILKHKK